MSYSSDRDLATSRDGVTEYDFSKYELENDGRSPYADFKVTTGVTYDAPQAVGFAKLQNIGRFANAEALFEHVADRGISLPGTPKQLAQIMERTGDWMAVKMARDSEASLRLLR